MIIQMAHACFTVADLDRAIGFYRDGLGLKEVFDFRKPDGHRFGIYLHAGASTFVELFEGKVEESGGKGSYRHICLQVDDLERTVREIRSRGIEVSAPKMGEDHSWQAWLADPDGNRIELHQYTPKSKQNLAK